MSKSVILAILVAAVIIGGIAIYIARSGIEKDQEPGQTAPTATESSQ